MFNGLLLVRIINEISIEISQLPIKSINNSIIKKARKRNQLKLKELVLSKST